MRKNIEAILEIVCPMVLWEQITFVTSSAEWDTAIKRLWLCPVLIISVDAMPIGVDSTDPGSSIRLG